jgi:hypothetical protein
VPDRTYLVFGDLHGRILPAFRLAAVWAREHRTPVAGLLQVGDLGYFPDVTRLDKATRRFAEKDPTELGSQDIIVPTETADAVFGDPDCPPALWFTAGNHEDHDALIALAEASGRQPDFVVDAYGRVRGVKDGRVVPLPGGPKVGAVWGVDGDGPGCRKNLTERAYIRSRSADRLLAGPFDVLLTHDSPADAKRAGYGSAAVSALVQLAQPAFAFFGHYSGAGSRTDGDFGRTEVYHLGGLALGGRGGCAEYGSVGALTWDGREGRFAFLDRDWLQTFTRHNWKQR